jgi:DNA polymerase III alpha subunit
MGIQVRLPHVAESGVLTEARDGMIYLGLSSIKYVSEAVAEKLVTFRPVSSVAELESKMLVRGTGMNRRTLAALNKVGAAKFWDNPLRGDESDYFYEYMGIPKFKSKNISLTAEEKMRPLELFDEKATFPVLAMARGIKRGPGWARVDFVDETGSTGIFTNQDTQIQSGQMYAMLVADNSIARYITVEELALGLEGNAFYDYLQEKGHSVPEDMLKTISFKTRQTRAGKKMAHVVVQDDTGALFNITVFPSDYLRAFMICKEGKLFRARVAETTDGTLFFEEISVE